MKKQLLVLGLLMVAANVEALTPLQSESTRPKTTGPIKNTLPKEYQMALDRAEKVIGFSVGARAGLNYNLQNKGFNQDQIDSALAMFDSSLTPKGLITTYKNLGNSLKDATDKVNKLVRDFRIQAQEYIKRLY